MKTFDNAQDKIQQISDQLKKETLEPAETLAKEIIRDAEEKAKKIIAEGEKEKNRLIQEARQAIEKERNVFKSSLLQASSQSIEALKQAVLNEIFDKELDSQVKAYSKKPDVIAKIIKALVSALEKEGIHSNLEVIIPKEVPSKEVVMHLADLALKKLEDGPISLGEFEGGVKIKLLGKEITFDVTDQSLKELISSYTPKDFRELIFQTKADKE